MKLTAHLLAGAMLAAVAAPVLAQNPAAAPLPAAASPEAEGFSSERLQRLDDAMSRAVKDQKIAGALTLLARDGKVVAEFVGAVPAPHIQRFLKQLVPAPGVSSLEKAEADAKAGRTAEAEVMRIAAIRLAALVIGDGALATTGRISTHVLDTVRGKPAAGVAVPAIRTDLRVIAMPVLLRSPQGIGNDQNSSRPDRV